MEKSLKPCRVPSLLFFFLYLTCLFSAGCSASPDPSPSSLVQSTTITYQAHSYDDLGEWRQLLAKGTTSLKVDMHYTLPPTCKTQARVFNSDTRGCYLLTHDAPSVNETYYTAYDMIAFLVDPVNRPLIDSLPNLYVYLAFKNSRDRYPAANITQSNNLQIEFVITFTNQLRENKLHNVQLIYDGIYINESRKAYTWPRTYAFATSDMHNPDSCLYSDKGWACYNTSVINSMANPLPFVDPGSTINRMCQVGFGKYSKSPYPWVFWEPTDQQTILYLLDAYLNCSIEHEPGMAIAINTDPVQYQIYAGTRSGKAWNERLFDDAIWAHAIPLSSDNSSVTFLTLYLTAQNKIIYSVGNGAFDVTSNNRTFPFGQVQLSPRNYLLDLPFATLADRKPNAFSFSTEKAQYVFISDYRGLVGIYERDASTLVLIANATIPNKRSESVALIGTSLVRDSITGITWIEVEFLQGYKPQSTDSCTFMIQWWKLMFDPSGRSHPELISVGDPLCAITGATLPFEVDSASLSIISNKNDVNPVCANSTHSGLLIVSALKTIYGGVVCVDEASATITICTDSDCTLSASSPPTTPQPILSTRPLAALDVGTSPSLFFMLSPSDKTTVALEVHGDGYCYNSDWNNKRAYPRICNSSPQSFKYVLNYNHGKLSDWANHIFDQRMISSCDESIFHGAYDEGSLPSAFLAVDHQNNLRMVEMHTGFPTGAIDYNGCSWPVPYDGAMMDGIVLPSLKFMGTEWDVAPDIIATLTPPNYDDGYVPPPSEATVSGVLCGMCKQKLYGWQTSYQSDYDTIHHYVNKAVKMCTLGRIAVGDGTVVGCKNLVLLYLPSLSVSLIQNIFSPDNCNVMSFCNSGNGTLGIVPDLNHEVAKQLGPAETSKQNLLQSSDLNNLSDTEVGTNTLDDPSYTVIRNAMKSILLESMGIKL